MKDAAKKPRFSVLGRRGSFEGGRARRRQGGGACGGRVCVWFSKLGAGSISHGSRVSDVSNPQVQRCSQHGEQDVRPIQ